MQKVYDRKALLFIIGLFVAVVAATFLMALYKADNAKETATNLDVPLLAAFQESNAGFTSITAQGWAELDHVFHNGEELFSFYESMKEVIGSDDLLSVDEYDDEGYAGITVYGTTAQGYNLDMVLQSMADEEGGGNTYVIVNLTDKASASDLGDIQTYLGKVFSSVSAQKDLSLLIEGKYDDLLSKREKKKITKAIFKALDGDIEEKVAGDGYTSYSGYTSLIENNVTSGDHKVNLQVALSDNEEDGYTSIYIGSPVVFSDF